MNKFKIIPIAKDYANKIRQQKKDDFGNEILISIAKGLGPCRVSLKPFIPNVDRRITFAHSPFKIKNVFNQHGPIFINANDVEEYADVYRFPTEIKADKINFPLSLIGYGVDQIMNFSVLVRDEDVDEMIEKIFNNKPEVAYLHARNAEACCFICKIERV